MSREIAKSQRRLVEAFNARDVETWVALMDPSVEYHSAITVPGGAVYHGHEGVRRYLADFEDAWGAEYHVEPEAFFDVGEHSLMFYVVRGRGQQSGAEVARPGAQVVKWRDGLLVYAKAYLNREDALKDLGVSEEALEPMAP